MLCTLTARRCLLVCVLAFAPFGCASMDKTETGPTLASSEPTRSRGRLGFYLGKYLTIEGFRADGFKTGSSTLAVDRINGQEVSPPISIWIDNIDTLPEGLRCVFNGYESGRMIGLPPEVAEAEDLPQRQAAWQFYTYFIVTSVVTPPDLPLSMDPRHG